MRFGAGIWMFGQFVDRYATDAYGPAVSTLEAIERAGEVGVDRGARHQLSVLGPGHHGRRGRAMRSTPPASSRGASRRTSTCASSPAARSPTPIRPFAGARSTSVRGGGRRRQAARRADGEAVAGPGRLRLPVPGRLRASCGGSSSTACARSRRWTPTCASRSSTSSRSRGPTSVRRPPRARCSASRRSGATTSASSSTSATRCSPRRRRPTCSQLVHEHGRLFTIEVNDNWREWDDDMAVGSVHLIETLEFFLAVRKIGWDQPILLDQFPFREDPVEAARASIDTMRAIDARARPARPRRARRGAGAPGRARRPADRHGAAARRGGRRRRRHAMSLLSRKA